MAVYALIRRRVRAHKGRSTADPPPIHRRSTADPPPSPPSACARRNQRSREAQPALRGADGNVDRRPPAVFPFAAFRPSRRQLLKTGAIGALGLWGAGIAGQWLPHPAWAADAPQGLAFFRAKDLPLVRAIVGSFLDWTLSADAAARQEAVMHTISAADGYFSSFTPAVQAEALQGLDLLGLAPVRWLGGLWAPWESAAPADVNRFVEGLRTGRLSLSRQLFQFLEGVATVGWYGQPASWPAIGYPGPPNVPRPSGERPL
jgi:hypothetical protein